MKLCDSCGVEFPAKMVIDGRLRHLYRRRFCLNCSPFGVHNTSKTPPGPMPPTDLKEHRRKKRNRKNYRRQRRKAELIAAFGGACVYCGYAACVAALEFHHRERTGKEFGLGQFNESLERLLAEAQKCDLLCANCHRIRHGLSAAPRKHEAVASQRRERKAKAVALMGGACDACGRDGPHQLFEFHHRSAADKDFGISEDGILRSWAAVLAELAKCVMLCANCHREVHAGVRELDEGLLGLAEDAARYVA